MTSMFFVCVIQSARRLKFCIEGLLRVPKQAARYSRKKKDDSTVTLGFSRRAKMLSATLLIAALLGVTAAVALSTPHTTLVLNFRQSSGCVIKDENGQDLTNQTTTLNNVNPGPGTVVTETYDVVNVGTVLESLQSFTAVDNNGAVSITYASPIVFPFSLVAGGSAPVSVIVTMGPNAATIGNTTIVITAVCNP